MIIRCALGLLLLVFNVLAQDELTSKDQRELEKSMKALLKSPEDDRAEASLRLLFHGRKGLEWLESQVSKHKDWQQPIFDVWGTAAQLMGEDLLAKEDAFAEPEWMPFLLEVDEVLLLRRDEEHLAGIKVLKDPNPAMGKLTFEWWSAEGARKKLISADSGQATVEGQKATKTWRPNTGYDEYDYDLAFADYTLRIRFVGPQHLVVRPDAKHAMVPTGLDTPKTYKTSESKLTFWSGAPKDTARFERRLQDYLYRILPGATALLVDDKSAADFSQYEQVRVSLRISRGDGRLHVLVRLAEHESSGLTENRAVLARRFARQIVPVLDADIHIAGGDAPALEGNQFWNGKTWAPPNPELLKFLRLNYSEDS
ncbi:MAG: hypothetical protein KDB53_03265 [Planctomycetes bacterium]|nr:hypothetical protein [Planctomycetota bacterium]